MIKLQYDVRIMRIQREISEEYIEAGTSKGNIRELIIERMKQRGDKCECIRCREIKGDNYDNSSIYFKNF